MSSRAIPMVALAIIAFLSVLIHALLTLSATEKELRQEIGESRIWVTAQAEREAMQLLIALADAYPEPEANDPPFRFELLYSRVSLLGERPQRTYFEQIGARHHLDQAVRLITHLDTRQLSRSLPESELRELRALISELASHLRELTNITSLRDRSERFAVRDRLSDALNLGIIAILGILFTCATMLFVMLRNMRRLRITQGELEAHRSQLEAAVALRTRELHGALDVERKAKEVYNSFMVTVAHQFRTPVSIINMVAQRQLREGDATLPEPIRRKFSRILEASVRLETLVTGFLASTESAAVTAPNAQREFDLNTAVDGALQRIALEAPDRRISTDLDRAPLTIKGDPMLIVQLVHILLSNAVRYSEPGTEVKVTTRNLGGTIRCDVSDRGRGIPEEAKQSVFERYYRAPEVHHLPGVGLGLPVARAIVAQHGGVISFTSETDRGTTFTISLPEAGDGERKL